VKCDIVAVFIDLQMPASKAFDLSLSKKTTVFLLEPFMCMMKNVKFWPFKTIFEEKFEKNTNQLMGVTPRQWLSNFKHQKADAPEFLVVSQAKSNKFCYFKPFSIEKGFDMPGKQPFCCLVVLVLSKARVIV
jgi:hypothetical protein